MDSSTEADWNTLPKVKTAKSKHDYVDYKKTKKEICSEYVFFFLLAPYSCLIKTYFFFFKKYH